MGRRDGRSERVAGPSVRANAGLCACRNAGRNAGLSAGLSARTVTRVVTCLVAAAMLVTGSRVQAQDGAPSLSAARVAAQLTGGALVAPVAFIGGGVLTKRVALALGSSEQGAGRAAYVGAYTATLLATAAVPALIGRDGKFPAALGGSALGLLSAAGVVRVGNWRYDGDRNACDVLCWTLGAVVVALPGIGATLLYNESRR